MIFKIYLVIYLNENLSTAENTSSTNYPVPTGHCMSAYSTRQKLDNFEFRHVFL